MWSHDAIYSRGIRVMANKQTGSIDLNAAKNLGDIATDTAQYFWFTSGGSDNGAHITEIDKETFQNTPAGGNLLATSNGIAVREALKELAIMSKDGFEAKSYDASDNEVIIAHLGYGDGNDSGGGTSKAPYYILGLTANTNFGNYSVCEGYGTSASGFASHSEGDSTVANNKYAHAEGLLCFASGEDSHAEGYDSKAKKKHSHAEGISTTANGEAAHSEGNGTSANADNSHAQNEGTIAGYQAQTAIGKYNDNKSANAFEIGNGSDVNNPSNAVEVDWNGNVDISGKYKIGGAQIGSVMRLKGSSYSSPLSTSYKTLNLSTTAEINNGNAFTAASNGIKCAYDGTVHLIGKVRFNDGFTANDYMMAQIYNTTQSTAIQTGRMRTPTQVFNGDVWVNAYARVSANDVLLLRAENATGGRGTVTIGECSLTACYISS